MFLKIKDIFGEIKDVFSKIKDVFFCLLISVRLEC